MQDLPVQTCLLPRPGENSSDSCTQEQRPDECCTKAFTPVRPTAQSSCHLDGDWKVSSSFSAPADSVLKSPRCPVCSSPAPADSPGTCRFCTRPRPDLSHLELTALLTPALETPCAYHPLTDDHTRSGLFVSPPSSPGQLTRRSSCSSNSCPATSND